MFCGSKRITVSAVEFDHQGLKRGERREVVAVQVDMIDGGREVGDRVLAVAGMEHEAVAAGAAGEEVVAAPADDHIAAAAAVDDVVAVMAVERVGAVAARQGHRLRGGVVIGIERRGEPEQRVQKGPDLAQGNRRGGIVAMAADRDEIPVRIVGQRRVGPGKLVVDVVDRQKMRAVVPRDGFLDQPVLRDRSAWCPSASHWHRSDRRCSPRFRHCPSSPSASSDCRRYRGR